MPIKPPAVIGFLLCGATLVGLYAASRTQPSITPKPFFSSQDGWADESSCADCHDQAESYWETGHALTLRPANTESSVALLEKLRQSERLRKEGTTLRIDAEHIFATTRRNVESTLERSSETVEAELTWCFGSGHHASTWTSTMQDSSGATDQLEFRWSWYAGDQVDVTPGQPMEADGGHFGKLGVLHDGPKVFRCFSCHSDFLPETHGQLDESRIHAGITCQRCHGPLQAHVDSDGDYFNPNWVPTDQLDAVNRCAQCHRRADEFTDEELTVENKAIVRFQPVGMIQSKCFKMSEMTCTTCHDPHTPMSQQNLDTIDQCAQCHNPAKTDSVHCSAGEVDECLACHMPKVKMDAPLYFTDHWIRIRKSGQ